MRGPFNGALIVINWWYKPIAVWEWTIYNTFAIYFSTEFFTWWISSAPALWPIKVNLVGSPPNRKISLFTHLRECKTSEDTVFMYEMSKKYHEWEDLSRLNIGLKNLDSANQEFLVDIELRLRLCFDSEKWKNFRQQNQLKFEFCGCNFVVKLKNW